MPRRQALLETLLVFGVFCLQGAWPAPEVNEPNYLGKAIHYWNPEWCSGDYFLETPDAHLAFYFTAGWLAKWLPPTALAWVCRLLTWAAMAWAWRRLSVAVAPRRWLAPLTATWFVAMVQHGNMAGEWVVGGAEAKGFAFALVFLALEALVLDRWNRTWLLLGAASAMHVLVGGWSIVAAGLAWLLVGKMRPSLRSMLPALAGGLLLSLPGLIPSLALNWGMPADLLRQANEVYVYQRLPQHLNPWKFSLDQLVPFAVLCLVWLAVGRIAAQTPDVRRLRAFVVASLGITTAGMVVSLLGFYDRAMAAGLLRFYWFRLTDVAIPIGIALLGARAISDMLNRGTKTSLARFARVVLLTGVVALAVLQLADCAVMRLFALEPHSDRWPSAQAWMRAGQWVAMPGTVAILPRQPRADRLPDFAAWLAVCDWVAHSGQVAPAARFLTPRMSQTFKWYTQRAEVGTWKEIPQDARGIVDWWNRMQEIHGTGSDVPSERWHESLAELGPVRLRKLAAKYHFDYVLTTIGDAPLALPVVYRNQTYIVYEMREARE